MENLLEKLVNKSVEAFIVGLELYNKPTLRYRIEGFSFFIINAWELMLKAELLKRGESVYYKDNPDRTLSVSIVIEKLYPDKHQNLRINLEKIIDLRNTSTHYITEDYEIKYAPLFQACVLNFVNEINRYHKVDITKYIAQNFLTISSSYEPLTNEQIKLKYPAEIAEKFIQQANDIDVLMTEITSEKFAIGIKQNLYITRKKSEADFVVSIEKGSKNHVEVVKDLKDPSDTHKYSYSNVITAVQKRLGKKSIKIDYSKGFNTYVLKLIIDFYNIKSDSMYAYKHQIGKNEQYSYSELFVEFIVNEIQKNPTKFVESFKEGK